MTGLRFCFLLIVSMVFCSLGAQVPQSAIERFGNRSLLPIEGVWKWNSGAMVVIEENGSGRITVTLIDSPDPTVDTPLVIGTGNFGGTDKTYNLELVTNGKTAERRKNSGKAKFVAKITDSGRLSLTPYSTRLRVNAWRLLPYLFRFSVTSNKEPNGLDGAIRIWPPLGSPEFPVIL